MNKQKIVLQQEELYGIIGTDDNINFNLTTEIIDCYNQGDVRGYNDVGGLIGAVYERVNSVKVNNCYNSGRYVASLNERYSALAGLCKVADFTNCFSLNYGWNPYEENVTYNGTDFLEASVLKTYASQLGANYKNVSGNDNRRISKTNLAIEQRNKYKNSSTITKK